MTGPITLNIPATPPSELSQNAPRSLHWGTKTKIKNGWKRVAGEAAIAAKNTGGAALDPFRTYVLDFAVYWQKGHRIVDDDNLIASCKYARDSIARVFDIDDRVFRTGEVTQLRDKTGVGYTLVTLRERDQ